MKIIFR